MTYLWSVVLLLTKFFEKCNNSNDYDNDYDYDNNNNNNNNNNKTFKGRLLWFEDDL